MVIGFFARNALVSVFGLMGIIGTGCREHSPEVSSPVEPQQGATTRLLLADLKGKPIDLAQYKGRTVFLNFWATWCKPCIREMPSIKQAEEALREQGVVFLLASNEGIEQIEAFKKHGNASLSLIQALNLEELNIEALPTTYIFNRKGEKVFSETGYRKWDDSSNIELIVNINQQK